MENNNFYWENSTRTMEIYVNVYLRVYHDVLVGGMPTPVKTMKVGCSHYSQYMENENMFQNTTLFQTTSNYHFLPLCIVLKRDTSHFARNWELASLKEVTTFFLVQH